MDEMDGWTSLKMLHVTTDSSQHGPDFVVVACDPALNDGEHAALVAGSNPPPLAIAAMRRH